MPRPILSERAARDLRRIRRYIAKESGIARADLVVDRIGALCRLLADQPDAGRAHPELGLGVRVCVSDSYLVFYVPRRGTIEIARVIDGRRDVLAAWSEAGPSNLAVKRTSR